MSSVESEAFRQAIAIVSADNSAGTDELAAIARDVFNRKLTTQEMVEVLRAR